MSKLNVGTVAQRLIELSGDLFFVITREGFIFALSKEWELILGRTISELRGAPLINFILEKDRPATQAALDAVIAGADIKEFRNYYLHKNGSRILIEWRAVLDEETNLVFAAGTLIADFRSRSEEFELEKQKSIQASKLASLGEMAAGIAHEVNNPLSIIAGYLKILEIEWNQGNMKQADFERILNALNASTDRAAKIINNLKNLARDGANDPFERAYVRELVESSLDLVRERFKRHGVVLETAYEGELWIDCRAVEISQVLLNLFINAFDAVEGHTHAWVKVSYHDDLNSHAVIKVSNSGTMISHQVKDKIFNPFFTTKLPGKGTGLGLSIAATIIRHHKGEIYLDEKSSYTTFVIRLPLSRAGKGS